MTLSDDITFTLYMIDLNNKFLFYLSIIIFPLGIFFNIISILIFRRKKFSKNNLGFYNIFIAIVNNIILVLAIIIYHKYIFYNYMIDNKMGTPASKKNAICTLNF